MQGHMSEPILDAFHQRPVHVHWSPFQHRADGFMVLQVKLYGTGESKPKVFHGLFRSVSLCEAVNFHTLSQPERTILRDEDADICNSNRVITRIG